MWGCLLNYDKAFVTNVKNELKLFTLAKAAASIFIGIEAKSRSNIKMYLKIRNFKTVHSFYTKFWSYGVKKNF